MRKVYIYSLIFGFIFNCLGQNPILDLKIDSITYKDSIPNERTFTINYNLENLTEKEVSFINCMYPISNNHYPDVKKFNVNFMILENDDYFNTEILRKTSIIKDKSLIWKEAISDEEMKIAMNDYFKTIKIDTAKLKKERQDRLKINDFDYVKSAVTNLKPNEKQSFTKILYWNKNRYYKRENLEYYIGDENSYYLELSFPIFKEEFRYFFSEEEYNNMKDNPYYISGFLKSNKVALNFKE